MARLTMYKDNSINSTTISNLFIDEYMGDANDAQLKVYLYLLRMLNANQATSVSEIADKFNHTEKEVLRALKYWEKKKLISIDYDAAGIPAGIHFKDLDSEAASRKGQSATSRSLAMFMDGPAATQPSAIAPAQPEISTKIQAPMPAPSAITLPMPDSAITEVPALYEKPIYNADQLREFKNRGNTEQLLFVAAEYIGKPLTPAEIKSILFYTDELHFSEELIDYLIQYCVDRGKKDFKYIDKVAISWAENHVTTPRQAQRYSTKYDKNVYAIMNALGKTGSPTNKEAEYITRWTGEYGFDIDVILEACERTVLATDRHRMEYAESILSSWKQENVHHKADIRKIDELYHKKKEKEKSVSSNRFNQFSQNTYDFDALEKELLRK